MPDWPLFIVGDPAALSCVASVLAGGTPFANVTMCEGDAFARDATKDPRLY